jgi:hypothetical protein
MIRLLCCLLVIVAIAHSGWAYYHVWELDRALLRDDLSALTQLIDLDAVRAERKERMESEVDQATGAVGAALPNLVREGASQVVGAAVEQQVTLPAIREELRWRDTDGPYPSLFDNWTFAFFEGPTTFLVRIGDLGQDPVHVRLGMQGWKWRVVAVYP